MIGNLTYDQVAEMSNQLKVCVETLTALIEKKPSEELETFVSVVDRYVKYLETTIELYKDADKAISELVNS